MIGKAVSKITTTTEDDVKWWFSEIDRGIKYRKPYLEQYERNIEFEDMNQWANEKGYRKGVEDEATVNKVGSYIRTRRAILGYNNPRAKYIPRNESGYEKIPVPLVSIDGTPMLDQNGQVIVKEIERYKAREHLMNDIISNPMFGLRETMTRLIKAGDLAYGALKVGFGPSFYTKPDEEGEQEIPLKDGRMDLSGFVRNPVDNSLVSDESGDRLISREQIPAWEDWFIDWTDFRRLIVDPDCENDTNQLRWIVEEEIRPLSDVKADDLFKNTKDLKGTGDDSLSDIKNTRLEVYDDETIKEKHERVRLFHIWDKVNDKYMVLADGHGKWLRNGKTPRGVYEDPHAFYRNNEKLGSWYQRPLVSDLIPVAMLYNIAWQQLMRAMQHSTRKVFVDSRAMDTINKDHLKSNEDMQIISIDLAKTRNGSLSEVLAPFVPPQVSSNIFDSLDRLDNDFYEIAGLPPEAVGTPKSNTATQANMANAYTGSRVESDRQLLASCLQVALKKLDDSIDANMSVPRAINIQGSEGQAFNALIDPDAIKGDYDLEIDVEDLAPKNSAMEGAQWIQASQVIGTAPWLVSEESLARVYLEKFGIKHEGYIKALVGAAKMQMQMMMQSSGPRPESSPPTSEADAMRQNAGGTQVPRATSAP